MSRFDCHEMAGGKGYLIDLQSDFLESYSTRIVAPLIAENDFDGAAKGLNPVVTLDGERFVILTHFMAAVPVSSLGKPKARLSDHADEITRALDLLFQGY